MLPSSPATREDVYPSQKLDWKVITALIVMLVVFTIAIIVTAVIPNVVPSGQLSAFFQAALEVIPFVMLAVLAYIGVTRDWGKVLALLWLLFILGGLAFNNIASVYLALLSGPLVPGQLPPSLVPGGAQQLLLVLGLSLLAMIVGGLSFVPAVRRWLSRFLPINPDSFVHTVALASVIITTLFCVIPLLVLGAPPTLEAIRNQPIVSEGVAEASSASNLIYRLVWALPGALFAVGYAIRRYLGSALERLGFVRPTLTQVAIGVGVAVLLVIAAQGIGWAIEQIWTRFGWPQTDAEAFEQLLADLLNPFGAVVIGVVAGISEELAVRGVLQPRLGILLSNVFFTSVHALQYSWDALLVVFLVGLAFGVLRKRANTTTSAIAHGVYNFILVMLGVLAQQVGS